MSDSKNEADVLTTTQLLWLFGYDPENTESISEKAALDRVEETFGGWESDDPDSGWAIHCYTAFQERLVGVEVLLDQEDGGENNTDHTFVVRRGLELWTFNVTAGEYCDDDYDGHLTVWRKRYASETEVEGALAVKEQRLGIDAVFARASRFQHLLKGELQAKSLMASVRYLEVGSLQGALDCLQKAVEARKAVLLEGFGYRYNFASDTITDSAGAEVDAQTLAAQFADTLAGSAAIAAELKNRATMEELIGLLNGEAAANNQRECRAA